MVEFEPGTFEFLLTYLRIYYLPNMPQPTKL